MKQQPSSRRRGGSLGTFASDLILSLGGQPTKSATQLFNAWQRKEGGWSMNDAAFNPLNLTAPGSGLPTINSVGVVSMPSYQVGVQRTADLIRKGYPALAQALRTGQVSFQDPRIQGDLNRWLSGKRTPGVSPYVSSVASFYGAPVPAGTGRTPPRGTPIPPSPLSPQAPTYETKFDPALFRSKIRNAFITGGGRMDLTQLPGMQQESYVQSPLKAVPTQVVQQRGIVSPGGDLKDPAVVNASPLLRAAASQIGKPYVFGSGPSTSSFDCSDLIQWAYGQIGVKLPRTTFDQIKMGRGVDPKKEALRPGDLVFPSNHHVVMYVGNGKVIAAPHTGTVVQYQPLSQFGELYAVRRIGG